MRNTGLEEAQAGIKIAGRNINNLRYADNTTLMAESEELKSLLVKVKALSSVRLLATPWTAAYQAPLSMGFSRQEYWSATLMAESEKELRTKEPLDESERGEWKSWLQAQHSEN